MSTHWDVYHRHWALLGPPLRPTPETVDLFERELRARQADMVLLGVTPELSGLGRKLLAVDSSPAMIGAFWLGDAGDRRAVVGDWLALPVEDASVDAVAGDGTPSNVGTETLRIGLLADVARVLKPDGCAAFRLFAAPEERENVDDVVADALAGRIGNFHALKWRVAMAVAGGDPDRSIVVPAIRNAIDALFPDREALAAANGWGLATVGTIDVYKGSDTAYSFAPQSRLVEEAKAFFDDVRIVPTAGYPLAERCPLLVLRSPKRSARV